MGTLPFGNLGTTMINNLFLELYHVVSADPLETITLIHDSKQVGNPTSTTSQLKTRDSKD
jgi:hypothetical protein